MKIFKKVISILSLICYVAIIFYAIIALPMIAGLRPMCITNSNLGKNFQKGSLFYYSNVEPDDIEPGYAVVYSNGKEKLIGVVGAVEDSTVTVWTQIQGKSTGKISENISYASILGMAKSANFPLIGSYFNFVNKHVAVIVLVGVILALRITFLYFDPEKNSLFTKASEEESFEKKLDAVLEKTNESQEVQDFSEIFTSSNEKNTQENAMTQEFELPKKENVFDNAEIQDNIKINNDSENETLIEEVKEQTQEEVAEVRQEETVVPVELKDDIKADANTITDYINSLNFEAKDNWYNAQQVDSALDMITAKVYSALRTSTSNDENADIITLREKNAETERKYLETEAQLIKANETISRQEEAIEKYKLMEQKVAKLLETLRAEKSND